jgi:hypothetical protein
MTNKLLDRLKKSEDFVIGLFMWALVLVAIYVMCFQITINGAASGFVVMGCVSGIAILISVITVKKPLTGIIFVTWTILVNLIIYSIQYPVIPWLIFVAIVLGAAEIKFLFFDKASPKKRKSKFWFTVERKLLWIFIFGVITLVLGSIYKISLIIGNWILKNNTAVTKTLLTAAEIVGILALATFILWAYIKLNSLKFRKRKK